MDTLPSSAASPRTRIRRVAQRASYDSAQLHAILDAAHVCHVAFTDAHGTHCIPTACWRSGDHLYIHGSNGSRMLKRLAEQDCCVTVTHVDGLVLARSAFHHSMNYRSAMVYGRFDTVDDAGKHAAMAAFMDHLLPGRQAEVRPGNDKEYAATTVMRLGLAEAVCKVRTGPPVDDEDDLAIPVWAGVLPLAQARGTPVPDARCAAPLPGYVHTWQG